MKDGKMGFGSPTEKKVDMYELPASAYSQSFNDSTTNYYSRADGLVKEEAKEIRSQAHDGRYSQPSFDSASKRSSMRAKDDRSSDKSRY